MNAYALYFAKAAQRSGFSNREDKSKIQWEEGAGWGQILEDLVSSPSPFFLRACVAHWKSVKLIMSFLLNIDKRSLHVEQVLAVDPKRRSPQPSLCDGQAAENGSVFPDNPDAVILC